MGRQAPCCRKGAAHPFEDYLPIYMFPHSPEHYRPTHHNPTERSSDHLHKVALLYRGLTPHLLILTLNTIVCPLSFPSLLIAIPAAEIFPKPQQLKGHE
jgi:hypothetical protein